MRRGFTLVELLMVITIIAILMGLLFPAVGMIKNQANAVRCSNNLQQIALGIEVYRQNHNDTFPGHLFELIPDGFDPKSFLCPFDKQRGADANMGRLVPNTPPANWGNYTRLHESASSYCYEASGYVDITGGYFTAGDIEYFYRDRAEAYDPTKGGTPNTTGVQTPAAGTVSWADGKLHQQKFGNLNPGVTGQNHTFSDYGSPFPASAVPIVRCYWHHVWQNRPGSDLDVPRKVNNISLGFNVFWSIPFWEIAINPNIPHN